MGQSLCLALFASLLPVVSCRFVEEFHFPVGTPLNLTLILPDDRRTKSAAQVQATRLRPQLDVNVSLPRGRDVIPRWCRKLQQDIDETTQYYPAEDLRLMTIANATVSFEGILFDGKSLLHFSSLAVLDMLDLGLVNISWAERVVHVSGIESLLGATVIRAAYRVWGELRLLRARSYDEIDFFKHKVRQSCNESSYSTPVSRLSSVAVFQQFYVLNYYHFVVDNMPHLVHLVQQKPELLKVNADMQVLAYEKKHILEFLEVLGVPRSNILSYDPCRFYHGDTVTFVEGRDKDTDPKRLQYVAAAVQSASSRPEFANILRGSVTLPPDSKRYVLMIDRRDKFQSTSNAMLQKQRQIRNHDQLLASIVAALPGHAVRNVRCAEFSVAEQLRLFAGASAVFGAEGACLANAVAMQPDSILVNINPARAPFGPAELGHCGLTYFWQLAEALRLNYWSFLIREADWKGEITVPLARFEGFVREVVQPLLDKPRGGVSEL